MAFQDPVIIPLKFHKLCDSQFHSSIYVGFTPLHFIKVFIIALFIIDLFPICLSPPAFQNITNWAEMKLYLLWRTVKSVITSCYTRLATIGAARRDAGRLSESAWEALHLGSLLAGPSQSGRGGKFSSSQAVKKGNLQRPEYWEGLEGERMPVMGVLGGGGGRLQRSSSVGRGDEARALTPSQPPRRAHSFRFPFVKFKTVSKSGTTSPNICSY